MPINLHVIEEGNAELQSQKMKFSITGFFSKCDQIRIFCAVLVELIYNSINPNANINKSISASSKLLACDTGFNLKQQDFPVLP